jgi:hypothetical protein
MQARQRFSRGLDVRRAAPRRKSVPPSDPATPLGYVEVVHALILPATTDS